MKECLNDRVKSYLSKDVHPMFINGKEVFGTGDLIEIVNPATEETFAKVSVAGPAEVDLAVDAAKKAFEGSWSKLSPADRELMLLRLADKIEEHAEHLAQIVTMENGKPVGQALSSDVLGAAKIFRYYAGWSTKITGETLDISMKQKPGNHNFAFTLREPVGVVAAIVPWNFPLSIASWKIAPALAAGCTVVLKSSEATPISSLYLAELFQSLDFPPGVFNVVTGPGSITGNHLIKHKDVNKIVFTGSTGVGKMIGKAAIDNVIPVSLELGGKSPAIVFNDADLDAAAKGVAAGIFRNAGQVCVAGSRLYVQSDVYDDFVDRVSQLGRKMKLSHGFDPEVEIGPLSTRSHFKGVCNYIEQGKNEGAELFVGGNNPKDKGFYMEPTIFKANQNDHMIIQEEIFGPVLVALPFEDQYDALSKANNSVFGLAGTIWTKDIDKALSCVNQLQSGLISVNAPVRSEPHLPLGGYKQSGIGKDMGREGLLGYTKTKSVNIVYKA